jgi:hypothetical protein
MVILPPHGALDGIPQSAGSVGVNKVVSSNLQDVSLRLSNWVETHGYWSADDTDWNVNAVPRGENLAKVMVRHFWRPSVFDRWEMTGRGLTSKAPDFAVELSGGRPIAGHLCQHLCSLPRRR